MQCRLFSVGCPGIVVEDIVTVSGWQISAEAEATGRLEAVM